MKDTWEGSILIIIFKTKEFRKVTSEEYKFIKIYSNAESFND